jgi:HPt (histidine-containing phosphotransfer) domain-containing protein
VPAFKPEKIEALIKDVGLAVTQTLVSKFLSESARRWDELQAAINSSENSIISREAHTLGSSCLTFGVESAGLLFRQIEAKSMAEEVVSLRDLESIERPLGEGIEQLESCLKAFD